MWKLSPLDDVMPDIDLCLILAFECQDLRQDRAASILSRAYEHLISENSVLTATIRPSPLSTTTRSGTKIIEEGEKYPSESERPQALSIRDARNEINLEYADLKQLYFPQQYLRQDLLLPTRETLEPNVRRTAAAQITFIRNGCFLSFNTSHALMDATGCARILEAWANHAARVAATEKIPSFASTELLIPLASDTATLNPYVGEVEYHKVLKHDARAWHMLGLDYRPRENCSALLATHVVPKGPTVTSLFRMEGSAIAHLKAECAAGAKEWISTNDALSALIWKSVIKARRGTTRYRQDQSSLGEHKESTDNDATSPPTTLMIAMSIRNKLSPPISSSYLGNVVLYGIVASTIESLISTSEASQEQVGYVAEQVRTAIEIHQKPHVLSTALQLAASIPDVSALGLVYPTWLGDDVVISSLYGLPLYQTSWGTVFGGDDQTPDIVRFPQGMFDGICFVMPKKKDASIELSLTMYEPDMERLLEDATFRRFAVPLGS